MVKAVNIPDFNTVDDEKRVPLDTPPLSQTRATRVGLFAAVLEV